MYAKYGRFIFDDSPVYRIFRFEKKNITYECDVYTLNNEFKLMPLYESIA